MLIRLPIKECHEIIDDIKKFWTIKDKFIEYDMVYKRGIIIYGPPGCGKSYLMQILIQDLVQIGGVMITIDTTDAIGYFIGFAQKFRQIEPNRPLVVIFEDIDNILEAGHSTLSALMNILDGVNQIDNVVYLATTNYPEKLQDRIANRPSRFDRVYHIDLPNAEVRRYYLENKLDEKDLKKIDLDMWVKKSEGLSISHIKELIVSVMIFGKEFDDVIRHFESMKKPKSGRGTIQPVGFGSGDAKGN